MDVSGYFRTCVVQPHYAIGKKWMNGWSADTTFKSEFPTSPQAMPASAWCDTRGDLTKA